MEVYSPKSPKSSAFDHKPILRSPKCTRCRNHGVINDLRGHKHKCFWRDCVCEKCLISSDRQRATADRIALFRQQIKEVNTEIRKSDKKVEKEEIIPNKRFAIEKDNNVSPSLIHHHRQNNISSTELECKNMVYSNNNNKDIKQHHINSKSSKANVFQYTHEHIKSLQDTNLEILKYIFPFYNEESLRTISRSYNDDVLQSVLSISKNVLDTRRNAKTNYYSSPPPLPHTTPTTGEKCCNSPYCPVNSYLALRSKSSTMSYFQPSYSLKRGYNMISKEPERLSNTIINVHLPYCKPCDKYGIRDDKFCSLCGVLY